MESNARTVCIKDQSKTGRGQHQCATHDLERLAIIGFIEKSKPRYKAYLQARIKNVQFAMMLDSGNTYASCMNGALFQALGLKDCDLKPVEGKPRIGTAKKGATMEVKGETREPLELWLSPNSSPIQVHFVVIPDLEMPCNLGGADLAKHKIDLKVGSHLTYKGTKVPLVGRSEFTNEISHCGAKLYTRTAVTVGPLERVHVPAVTTEPGIFGKDVVISSINEFEERFDLHPWRSVIVSIQPLNERTGITKVGMMNTTGKPIFVPAGTYYGTVETTVTRDQATQNPFSVCLLTASGSADQCSRASAKEVSDYKLPPPPDCQNDVMLGDKVELPQWMRGATNSKNWRQRFEYIKELYQIEKNKNMPELEQRSKFILLLLRFWDVFAWDGQYGSTHLVKHYIRTPPGCPPVNEPYRPPNPLLLNSLKEQLITWLEKGVIVPSDSSWNSNMLAVAKKDHQGAVRWVTDFRKLNQLTEIDRFPIGDISANLSKLGGSKYFSALDNSGAFHIIDIAREDQHKTSFATPFNCFMYQKLPFGLSGGPSSYARLVTKVLKGIDEKIAVSFVDDVLCHSPTFNQHLYGLERIFHAYRRGGLKLNPKKCVFVSNKIDYLGFTVSEKGIGPQEAYLEIIKNWPLPKTRQDMLIFLSKCSYYRRFVKDYSKIAEPLTKFLRITDGRPVSQPTSRQNGPTKGPMTKTERRKRMAELIEHNKESKAAFELLKNKLISAPILGHPRFVEDGSEPFILDTDWCQETGTISGCLSQLQKQPDGSSREVAIGYAAKKLSKSQQNYSSVKGEVCAVLYFMRYYAWFLLPQKFLVRTDSIGARALKNGLRDNITPPGMAERWQLRLEAFNFDIAHRAGTRHGNADALSRCAHVEQCEPELESDVFDENTDRQYLFSVEEAETWTPEYISQVQDEDEEISRIKRWVREGTGPTTLERAEASRELKSMINLLESLEIGKDEVLRYNYVSKSGEEIEKTHRKLIVLPLPQLQESVKLIHESIGHLALVNTIEAALKRVYGPGLRSVAEVVCNTCLTCQAKAGQTKPQRHTLQPPRQGYPGMSINADIVGPLQATRSGYQYILTVEDMFSRWLEAYPLRRCTGIAVANKLAAEYFPRFGFPSIMKFDRGTSFKNTIMKELAESIGARVVFSPSYSPKSNPVERMHRSLKSILKAMILDKCAEQPHRWDEFLPAALFCLRTMRNKSTGYSPFELTFGRPANTELDIIFGNTPQRQEYPDYTSFNAAYTHNMQRAFKWANDNISSAIRRSRRYHYNQPQYTFRIGQKVWLLTPIITPGKRKSFKSPWSGPWTIKTKVNEVVYEISPHPSWSHRKTQVVTVDRLKAYQCPHDEADADSDESDTHPPGINDDLSFPGDEFLENIPTATTQDSDLDDDDDEPMLLPRPHQAHQPQLPPVAPQRPPTPPQPQLPVVPEQQQPVPLVQPAAPQAATTGTRQKRTKPNLPPPKVLPPRKSSSTFYRAARREREEDDDDAVLTIKQKQPSQDPDLETESLPDELFSELADDVLGDEFPSQDLSNQDVVYDKRRRFAQNPNVDYHSLGSLTTTQPPLDTASISYSSSPPLREFLYSADQLIGQLEDERRADGGDPHEGHIHQLRHDHHLAVLHRDARAATVSAAAAATAPDTSAQTTASSADSFASAAESLDASANSTLMQSPAANPSATSTPRRGRSGRLEDIRRIFERKSNEK